MFKLIMIIKAKVKPNSNFEKIEKISENEYKINLNSAPDKNKANIELVKILKKHFKKDIKIIKGMKSRDKIVEVK